MFLRAIAILLITANLGLWMWQRQLPPPPKAPQPKAEQTISDVDPGVPSIEMVMHVGDESSQCSSFGPLRTPLEQRRAVERTRDR